MNDINFNIAGLDQLIRERPQLAVLRYINPADFRPHHLKQLYRLERHSWDGTTAVECARRIAVGEVWLWEVGDDDEHAIVLTSILSGPGPRQQLWIDGAAGNGIISRAADIIADLKLIAAFYDCATLGAASEREGFKSLPDLFGFEPVSTIWQLEVDDGGRQEATLNDHDDAEG